MELRAAADGTGYNLGMLIVRRGLSAVNYATTFTSRLSRIARLMLHAAARETAATDYDSKPYNFS